MSSFVCCFFNNCKEKKYWEKSEEEVLNKVCYEYDKSEKRFFVKKVFMCHKCYGKYNKMSYDYFPQRIMELSGLKINELDEDDRDCYFPKDKYPFSYDIGTYEKWAWFDDRFFNECVVDEIVYDIENDCEKTINCIRKEDFIATLEFYCDDYNGYA